MACGSDHYVSQASPPALLFHCYRDHTLIRTTVSQGYFVNLLRVRKSGILSRHRHTGPVHATVLRGRWHYLEHPWWAEEGSYAMEPPGDIHTLEVPDGVDEMVTMFHVTGVSFIKKMK